jgi:hypothetical protein
MTTTATTDRHLLAVSVRVAGRGWTTVVVDAPTIWQVGSFATTARMAQLIGCSVQEMSFGMIERASADAVAEITIV